MDNTTLERCYRIVSELKEYIGNPKSTHTTKIPSFYLLDELISLINEDDNIKKDQNLQFYVNILENIRAKMILRIGNENDFKYIIDPPENNDGDNKFISTDEFYDKFGKYLKNKRTLLQLKSQMNTVGGGISLKSNNEGGLMDLLKIVTNKIDSLN